MEFINGFFKEYRFLSNFYPSPVEFDSLIYPTVENAYQAAKVENGWMREQFVGATPAQAKKFGRQVVLREGWENIKVGIMEDLLIKKFSIPELKELLLSTGDYYLEETNTWGDKFWGVCDGEGFNMLGLKLMQVRDLVR